MMPDPINPDSDRLRNTEPNGRGFVSQTALKNSTRLVAASKPQQAFNGPQTHTSIYGSHFDNLSSPDDQANLRRSADLFAEPETTEKICRYDECD